MAQISTIKKINIILFIENPVSSCFHNINKGKRGFVHESGWIFNLIFETVGYKSQNTVRNASVGRIDFYVVSEIIIIKIT